VNEDLERLWAEKEKIIEQINPFQEKLDEIDNKIQEIRDNCPHKNIEIVNASGRDYDYSLTFCKDCNEWIV
jgi:uncharacterized coiled-coil DUF342 family protein